MTAVADLAPPTGRADRGGDQAYGALAGTRALIRFILRRDRVRLPVWIGSLTLVTVTAPSSFINTYADKDARDSAVDTLVTPAGLAMTGPEHYTELPDYHYGAMMGHQMVGFTVLMVGLMSVLLIGRHTRVEEESGRAELVRATVVGRHAHLAAAVIVVVAANVVMGLLMALGLGATGVEGITWSGSWLYGAAHAAVGIVFVGVAAVGVQVTEHSRGATGIGLAVLGAAYVLRAAGDVGNGVLSWLSPIGWAQATYVYVDNRWWPLGIALPATVVLLAVGLWLNTRRDVGLGLRQARAGRPGASQVLGTPLGFAVRLHRGLLISFAAGLALLGAAYGSILGSAEEMVDTVDIFKDMGTELGAKTAVETLASAVMIPMSIVTVVYVVLAMLRVRAEESAGRAEPVLATSVSRTRWLASHVVVVLAAGSAVMAIAGLGFALAGVAAVGDAGLLWTLFSSALANLPALWVAGGLAVALFGWWPRAVQLAWIVPVYGFVVGYLGELFGFPGWMNDISPFGHIPRMPAEDFTLGPLVVLTLIAAALSAAGLAGLRRRDLEAN